MITKQLILQGVVQGVGMRFYINRTAKQYNLFGQVRNLRDGTVECIVQGPELVISAFTEQISKQSPGVIEQILSKTVDTTKQYKNFSIKLW